MADDEKQYGYGKRPLWQWIALYIVIGVVIYGLVYYFVLSKNGKGYSNNSTAVPSYTTPTSMQTTPTSTVQTQKITVEGSEFAFTPSTFTLKKGQQAEITFKNTGAFPHNLTIAGLNIQTKTIQPGDQDTIQFTPDKTGQFSFMCTVPGHADKGMKGTLTVQ